VLPGLLNKSWGRRGSVVLKLFHVKDPPNKDVLGHRSENMFVPETPTQDFYLKIADLQAHTTCCIPHIVELVFSNS
jgi:hypothetical protein